MKVNVCLMLGGAGFLAAAFYRMGGIRLDRKFMIDLLPLVAATIILFAVTHRVGGMALTSQGLSLSMKMIGGYAPMLTAMFLAMGLATAIINLHREVLLNYLAGKSGVFGSLLSAYLMPGSLTSMPIVKDLWYGGANHIPLIVFLLTTRLVGWQVMLICQPMLGWRISAVQFGLGTVVAFLITAVGWICMAIR